MEIQYYDEQSHGSVGICCFLLFFYLEIEQKRKVFKGLLSYEKCGTLFISYSEHVSSKENCVLTLYLLTFLD